MTPLRMNAAAAACVIAVIAVSNVGAQDMTVYTTVSEIRDGEASRTVGSSLTLFHGGKVYDYLEDAGELVVLEPQDNRFTLLNSNYTATPRRIQRTTAVS